MFNWFNKKFTPRKYPTWEDVPPPTDMEKIENDMSKVVPFPELKAVPLAPKEEPVGKTCYSVGLTDNNRVSLHVGYGSVTMNAVGVQNLIDHLTLLKGQIEDQE
jgi:hypothetical protein